MIGNPIRCCNIDYTGKTTITPILEHPSWVDIGIYFIAYIVMVCFIYKQLEDRNTRQKQYESMRRRRSYDTSKIN
jgi:hypothetical protein